MQVTTERGDAVYDLLVSVSGHAAVRSGGDPLVLELVARMCMCAESIAELQEGALPWGAPAPRREPTPYGRLSDAALLALADAASDSRPMLAELCAVWREGVSVESTLTAALVEKQVGEHHAMQSAAIGEAFKAVARLWGGARP